MSATATVGRQRAIWLIVAQGGWWKSREIKEMMPAGIPLAEITTHLWIMEKRTKVLVSRGERDSREYSVSPECAIPMYLTVKEVVEALTGPVSAVGPTPYSDLRLMHQAMRAIDGLIEVGTQRGVKPTDITRTIRDGLRRRLVNSALRGYEQLGVPE